MEGLNVGLVKGSRVRAHFSVYIYLPVLYALLFLRPGPSDGSSAAGSRDLPRVTTDLRD